MAPGAAVTALVDEDITWETTSSLDIGVDLGFLGNKLNIEADYFNKKSNRYYRSIANTKRIRG